MKALRWCVLTVHGVAAAVFHATHSEVHAESLQVTIPEASAAANGKAGRLVRA